MESIKSIYKIGYGPSSSHTMGPSYAAKQFLDRNSKADKFTVELFGSLALTGRGHLTDVVLKEIFGDDKVDIIFNINEVYTYHPNAMKFKAYKEGIQIDRWLCFSVGGGDIRNLDEDRSVEECYKLNDFTSILSYCDNKNITLVDYIDSVENTNEYLNIVVEKMQNSVENGLKNENILPGSLHLEPRAKKMYENSLNDNNVQNTIFSFALSASEENARGHVVVTAPTCGSCGVLAAIVYYSKTIYNKEHIVNALKIAGLVANIVRTNASISGAEVGCQGEIGVACSMAAAAYCYLRGGSNIQIEYAAEIALEHHLGMTCDPIGGYVQIPCIERNAMSAIFAMNAADYALNTDGKHYVSFDHVVQVMKETGLDLHSKYKETSIGGLARFKK